MDKIKRDYDAESVLRVYNQGCPADKVWTEAVGEDAIADFFTTLFASLGEADGTKNPGLNIPNYSDPDTNPIEEPESGVDDTANVFLTWQSPADAYGGILEATDTFLWSSTYKITKQNIVVNQPGNCAGDDASAAPDGDWNGANSSIKDGWENHLRAFGEKDESDTGIIADYIETSVVRVFNWAKYDADGTDASVWYSRYEGIAAISGMFTQLFSDIRAGETAGDNPGDPPKAGAPVVLTQQREYDFKTVFLVWESGSHPRATDTFLFNDEGKIVRQTIVVNAPPPAPGAAQVQAIV